MDPQVVRARIADLSRALSEIEVSSDMAPRIRTAIAGQLDIMAADAERNLVPDVRGSTDSDVRDDCARFFRQLAMTNSWLDGRDNVTRTWVDRAVDLAASDVLRDLLRAEQNSTRDAEAFAGISALCQQGRVDAARRQLVARRRATHDPVIRQRIDEVLADPRNLMGPVASLPTLSTVNGFGTMLHGNRDRGADGTFVATLCITVLFMPLLPLRSYLVRQEDGNSWRFFGRVPLSAFAFWYRRLALAAPLMAAFAFWGWETWNSSPFVTETRLLAAAESHLSKKDYPAALKALGPMSGTRDAGRAARLDDLAGRSLTAALGGMDAAPFLATAGSAATRIRRPWSAETESAAEAAFHRITGGKTARDFLSWHKVMFPKAGGRRTDMAAKACEKSDDPMLLALAADLFVEAGRPCPSDLLERLEALLIRADRHTTWNVDALSYLRAADPADAMPVLLARSEEAWKGKARGADLLALEHLPGPLRLLLTLDGEGNLETRAAALEKAADQVGLGDPQKTWHRMGVAKRLLETFAALNEKDPIKHPVSRMRRWAVEAAELAPEDGETRVTALRYLLEDGEFDKVIAIGSRATGDAKTATLVGIALARSGKTEEAANLLRPLVARDLPTFALSYQQWEKAYEDRSAALWKTLEKGTAARAVLARLNALPKDKAQHEADKWVREQVDRDAHVAQLRRKWRERVDIHPAASELAMVELGLGRALPPGPQRQARLQAAEHLFLELRKTAQDDPHQELQLGQVYFWLGKDKEGAEIFARLEATGDADVLHQLGSTYRTLSRMDAARRVLEAAYGKAETPQKRSAIAVTRSMSNDDFEDRLVWLNKCEPKDEHIRMEIDQVEAWIDLAAGKHADAAAALKRVAEYYTRLPENATNLNNGSIVQLELAKATGNPKHQLEALRLIRRAHELQPEDAIILSNYVSDLQKIGLSTLAGSSLRADLLHELPGFQWLDYVVPRLSPQEWAAKAKAQPELRRAAELAPKVVILSPESAVGYGSQAYYLTLTRDGAALKRLRESIELRPPAREEQAADSRRYARGEYTDGERKASERALMASEALLARLRKADHPATLAYALTRSAGLRVRAMGRKVVGQTMAAAIRDAEEAVAAFDAPPTRYTLAWIRMEQAAEDVAASDPEFARWVKENPSLDAGTVLPLHLRKHPDRVAAVRGREAVRKASTACAEAIASGGRNPSISCWAWLEMAGHESRETARKALQTHPTYLESRRVDRLLNPYSADDVMDAWLAAVACGEKELADAIAAQAKADDVIPLFFK